MRTEKKMVGTQVEVNNRFNRSCFHDVKSVHFELVAWKWSMA